MTSSFEWLPPGTASQAQQDNAQAEALYEEATDACPTYAPAFYNSGVLQAAQGQVSSPVLPSF